MKSLFPARVRTFVVGLAYVLQLECYTMSAALVTP